MSKRLQVNEAAEYVGVNFRYLEKLRTAGGGPRFIKLPRKVLYDTADLDRWLEFKKQSLTADIPDRRRVNIRSVRT